MEVTTRTTRAARSSSFISAEKTAVHKNYKTINYSNNFLNHQDKIRVILSTKNHFSSTAIKKIPNNIAEFINLPLSKRINILVSDLVKNSWACTGFENAKQIPIIKMSNDISNLVTELRNYMFENFYLPVSNSEQGKTAYRIVRLLFDFYLDNEQFIPKTYYKAGQNIETGVADYICGMTDNFAIEEACGGEKNFDTADAEADEADARLHGTFHGPDDLPPRRGSGRPRRPLGRAAAH